METLNGEVERERGLVEHVKSEHLRTRSIWKIPRHISASRENPGGLSDAGHPTYATRRHVIWPVNVEHLSSGRIHAAFLNQHIISHDFCSTIQHFHRDDYTNNTIPTSSNNVGTNTSKQTAVAEGWAGHLHANTTPPHAERWSLVPWSP